MDGFSYLSVLITIILGLGITQLMTGLGRFIVSHERVHLYWPTVAWVALLLVLHVLAWWTMFGLRYYHEWSFLAFLIVLLQPILLYLIAAVILSNLTAGSQVDLEANYYANAGWFFGLLVLYLCVSLLKDLVLYGRFPEKTNLAAHVIFMALATAAMGTRSKWYHKLLVPMSTILIGAYIAVLFARLH